MGILHNPSSRAKAFFIMSRKSKEEIAAQEAEAETEAESEEPEWNPDTGHAPIFEFPERTKRARAKRKQKTDLTELVTLFADLSPAQWKRLPIGGRARETLEKARGMNRDAARKRVLRQVVGFLRSEDQDVVETALKIAMAKDEDSQRHARFAELWRERLIADGDSALKTLMNEKPEADRTRLRQLMLNARKDPTSDKAARARKALYVLLREIE